MFGMRVQRQDGRKAERWRAGVRSLIAWAPVIALALFRSKVPFAVQEGLIAVTLIGIGWSLVRPSRGPVDLIMGTVLMPK